MTTAPNQPAGEPTGAPASARPMSVTNAVRVLLALVVVTGLSALLVWLRQD